MFNPNTRSKKAKHTSYARWTSIMKKLDNQMEKEKKFEKIYSRSNGNDVNNRNSETDY